MDADTVSKWMLAKIETEACVYQDDVVDYLIKAGREDLLIENADGNQVLGKGVLAAFRNRRVIGPPGVRAPGWPPSKWGNPTLSNYGKSRFTAYPSRSATRSPS